MFDDHDLKMYNGFKKLVHSSELNVKGDAGLMVGVLFKWFEDLGGRIKKSADEQGKILSVKVKEGELNGDN